MLFCSYNFLAFLVIVLLGLRLSERIGSIQKILLLIASNYFYACWDWRFLSLIWISIITDYCCARFIARTDSPKHKKIYVGISLLINFGILIYFKYSGFFISSFFDFSQSLGMDIGNGMKGIWEIVLPIGISFYTFQSVAYTLDVYRGRTRVCENLIHYACFVCFFPQLVAGPIERASRLLPQLANVIYVRWQNVLSGALLITWGVFKKSIIADNVGRMIVDPAFANPECGLELWIGVIGFSIQIYCDFSGYCDVARGTARCMGVSLSENFIAPYTSVNIRAFWQRWHATLSAWFKDYVYIPLGGNRMGRSRTIQNLIVTMLLCGLWHGAALRFIVWGIYHGVLLALSFILRVVFPDQKMLEPLIYFRMIGTFILVSFGWVFFRAEGTEQAFAYAAKMFDPESFFGTTVIQSVPTLVLFALPVFIGHWTQLCAENSLEIEDLPVPRWLIGCAFGFFIVAILTLGGLSGGTPFIYFQF